MHTEHHIDSFDLPSFFKLHDLNLDGFWDEAEIQAVYGLHHHSVKGKLPESLVDGRADVVVKKVLEKLDTNSDGKSSIPFKYSSIERMRRRYLTSRQNQRGGVYGGWERGVT